MAPTKTKLSDLTINILITLMVSGCSLAPDYHRPDAAVPTQWNQHDMSLTVDDGNSSSGPYFRDERLQQLIRLTVDGNKDLQKSVLNLKKVGEQYGVERLSMLPNVALSAEETASHLPGGIFDTVDTGAVTYHQYDVKLVSASWEIDFWGRLRSLKEASLNEYLAAGASSRALRINLIESTVNTYFNYLSSREAAGIASQLLKNKEMLRNMAYESMNAGAISQSDAINASKEVERAGSELALLKLQAQKDYNTLQLLVGRPIPDALLNGASIGQDWKFSALKSGLPSDILLKRPDIVAAEYELKAANARIGAARAAFFPSVSITAEGGTSSAELGNLMSGGTQNWSFVPAINLPIFDGGKNKANLSIAELNKQVEIINYQKSIQQAFRDVTDALASLSSTKIQSEQSEAIYAAAVKQYDMAVETQKAGEFSRETILHKNSELLEAQNQALDSRLNFLVQSIRLYSVMGGDNSI